MIDNFESIINGSSGKNIGANVIKGKQLDLFLVSSKSKKRHCNIIR